MLSQAYPVSGTVPLVAFPIISFLAKVLAPPFPDVPGEPSTTITLFDAPLMMPINAWKAASEAVWVTSAPACTPARLVELLKPSAASSVVPSFIDISLPLLVLFPVRLPTERRL